MNFPAYWGIGFLCLQPEGPFPGFLTVTAGTVVDAVFMGSLGSPIDVCRVVAEAKAQSYEFFVIQ